MLSDPAPLPARKLLPADVRKHCGDNAYLRGQSYLEQQQVQAVKQTGEGALFIQINSTVKGHALAPYKQNIRIIWRPDYTVADIQGDCSCPVGYNCKHVAAVCLSYVNGYEQPGAPSPGVNCLAWLRGLSNAANSNPDLSQDFLAYFLRPGKNAYEFIVELAITKAKKNGGMGKGRKISLSNLRYSYSYLHLLQPEDEDITKLLAALGSQGGCPLIAGDIGCLALAKMLRSQRLYWHECEQPLTAEAPRALEFTWQHSETGYRLLLQLPDHVLLIPTDPPQFLDTEAASLGNFDINDLSAEQLQKILAMPLVPDELADEFSRLLIMEHPRLPLPPPKPLQLTELNELTPTPLLRLFGQQTGTQYRHLIELRFRYQEHTLEPGTQSHYIIADGQRLIRIRRDLATEQHAADLLAQQGLTAYQPAPSEPRGYFHFDMASPIATATAWHLFLSDALPQLEQQGWLVATDPSFLLNFQTAQAFVADIGDSGNDWFDLGFNLEINGQSHALLPLIMPVLENYDLAHLPELLSIPLADHSYLNLPSEQLRPILNVLHELFNSNALSQDGKLTLSRFNVASLSCLEEHAYGLFAIRGGKALRELAQKLKDFAGIQPVAPPAGLNAQLRAYQQQGLNWLQFLREYQFGGILADDMGLGKTLQTLAHLLVEKRGGRMTAPSLIVAPTSLMGNWRRECERFTPDLTLLTLQGTDRSQSFGKIGDYDLILTTYPLLSRDEEILLAHDYHYLILDEAQNIKNPLSKAAQLVRQIKTKHRLCLTGTPMENHLGELWAQFDFLMPGFLGDSAQFKRQYRTPIESHGDPQQRLRLARRIAPFMLRRSKQEVARELPAKTEIIRAVALYPKQAALYESIRLTMEQKVREAIAQKGLARSHITILDALLKLRQTCCDPRTLALEAGKIKASAKLDLLMEILPEQLLEGRRILVFSQFTRMIALIENELNARNIHYSKLTGQTKKREEAIALFKDGSVNVFLISLKAGGVGLNLTEADTVIIYDPWWNPATESQAADRAHRIGQDKPVFIYKLITENTVEEKILAMQERKRALTNGIYQEESQQGPLQLTADDLTALFEPL